MKIGEKIESGISYVITKPARVVVIVLALVLSYNGVIGYWSQFKNYIVSTELQKEGFVLQKQERSILAVQEGIDSVIKEQEKEVVQKDIQTYDKQNEKIKKSFRAKKGIVITDNDINGFNADSLLSKYTKK